MKELVIYVHGKGGEAEETEHYKPLFPKSDVIGFDYKSQNPWKAKNEFSDFYDLNTKGYDSVILIANSIGAFFSMNALAKKTISKALFISPFFLFVLKWAIPISGLPIHSANYAIFSCLHRFLHQLM